MVNHPERAWTPTRTQVRQAEIAGRQKASQGRSVTRQNKTREAGGAGRSGVAQPTMTETPRMKARRFRQQQRIVRQQARQENRKQARQEVRRQRRIKAGQGVETRRRQRVEQRRFERQQPKIARALHQQRGYQYQGQQVANTARFMDDVMRNPQKYQPRQPKRGVTVVGAKPAAKGGVVVRSPRSLGPPVKYQATGPSRLQTNVQKALKSDVAKSPVTKATFKGVTKAAGITGLGGLYRFMTQPVKKGGPSAGQFVIDQSTRGGNFVAGVAESKVKDIQKGRDIASLSSQRRALSAGAKSATAGSRKKRRTASDVFNTAGWKKKSLARTLAAAGTDMALDPLSYTGVGTASRAMVGARRAARAASEKESTAAAKVYGPQVARGTMSKREAQDRVAERGMRAGQAAMRSTLKKATPNENRLGLELRWGAAPRSTPRAGANKRRVWSEVRRSRKEIAREGEEFSRVTKRGGPVAPKGKGKRHEKPKTDAERKRVQERKRQQLAKAKKADRDRKARSSERYTARIPKKSTPVVSSTGYVGAQLQKLPSLTRSRIRKGSSEQTSQVRPPNVEKRDFEIEKAIQREFRAETQRLQRRTMSRLNAVKHLIDDDEMDTLIDAIEADDRARLVGTSSRPKVRGEGTRPTTRAASKGYRVVARRLRVLASEAKRGRPREHLANRARKKAGKGPMPTLGESLNDPDRLAKVADQIVADLKYIERRAVRTGIASSHIGKRATRSRKDVELAIKANKRPRDISRRLKEAEARLAVAPLAERTDARRRVQALRGELRQSEQTRKEAVQARKTQAKRQAKRERTEAQGYFPRVDVEDIARRESSRKARRDRDRAQMHDQPEIERVFGSEGGAKKPKPGPAEQRVHRKSRAQLRAGTPAEKELVKRWSSDVSETLGQYYRSMSKGIARAEQNQKAFKAFGTRTGGGQQAVNLATLRAEIPRETKALMDLGRRRVYMEGRAKAEPTRENKDALRRLKEREAKQAEKIETLQTRLAAGRYKASQPLRSISPQQSVYELRRGGFEEVPRKTDFGKGEWRGKATRRAMEGERGKNTRASGQYYVATRPQIDRVLDSISSAEQKSSFGQFYDRWQGRMKKLLLATPGYLFRNLTGDLTNAWSDEAFWKVMRETIRGAKDLNALGRYERAQRRFDSYVPKPQKKTKITERQRAAIRAHTGADPGSEITTLQLGLLAEEFGAIRQGRFEEMFEEGVKPGQTSWWEDAVKRVEDTARIATFRGSLDRGMDPRQAASRVAKLHFDYGDLSQTERNVLRRLMPFYTFTSRNVPLWGRTMVQRPGKLNKVGYAQVEAEKHLGLEENYRDDLNEYEKRQFGIPVRIGKNIHMISLGSPFVDINTPASLLFGPLNAGDEAIKRATELFGPFVGGVPIKPLFELWANKNFFYRTDIEDENTKRGIRTEIPGIVQLILDASDSKTRKALIEAAGITEETNPSPDGPAVRLVWRRKADHAFRSFIGLGPIGVLSRSILAPKESARGMSKAEQRLSAAGVRTIETTPQEREMSRLFEEVEQIDRRLTQLRKMPNKKLPMVTLPNGNKRYQRINAESPTPEYTRLTEEYNKKFSRAIDLYESDKVYSKGRVRGTPETSGRPGGANLSGLRGQARSTAPKADLSGLKKRSQSTVPKADLSGLR